MVKTKNICKAFCDNEVLKGINVEIEHRRGLTDGKENRFSGLWKNRKQPV